MTDDSNNSILWVTKKRKGGMAVSTHPAIGTHDPWLWSSSGRRPAPNAFNGIVKREESGRSSCTRQRGNAVPALVAKLDRPRNLLTCFHILQHRLCVGRIPAFARAAAAATVAVARGAAAAVPGHAAALPAVRSIAAHAVKYVERPDEPQTSGIGEVVEGIVPVWGDEKQVLLALVAHRPRVVIIGAVEALITIVNPVHHFVFVAAADSNSTGLERSCHRYQPACEFKI